MVFNSLVTERIKHMFEFIITRTIRNNDFNIIACDTFLFQH